MVNPPRRSLPASLFLTALLLVARGNTPPAVLGWNGSEHGSEDGCGAPGADRCVVLACDEGACGLFACEDVEPVAELPAQQELERVRGRPLMRGPGTYREWWQRRTGVRGGARPFATLSLPPRRSALRGTRPGGSS